MMDGMSKHARLSTAGQCWLAVAVLFVMAGMGIAFWYSFANLSAAGAAHGWHPPYLLPLMIDTGVPAYVIIDQLIVALGWRSLLPRLAAWAFAMLTVFLNGAASADPSLLWRVTHAAMPAAWILGIEALRLVWRVLRKDASARRRHIPPARWLLAFRPTLALWKRMRLWDITDYGEALRMELARLRAIESLTVLARGRDWRTAGPGDVAWMLETGTFMDEALAKVAELTAVAKPVAPPVPTARKRRPATGRKRQPAKGAATALSPEAPGMDVDTEALILRYIGEGKSASEAGRLAGVTDSRGRQVARKLAETAPATGEQPRVG